MKYKIIDILHSGRKGVRNTPVDEPKYNGLVGSIVTIKGEELIENCKQFEPLRLNIISGDSEYDEFKTSVVIGLALDWQAHYRVETINSIYVLEMINLIIKNEEII